MVVARVTGAPIWPGSATPLAASIIATVVHAALAVIVGVLDRRAWAAWRAGRRARLAESVLRKQA